MIKWPEPNYFQPQLFDKTKPYYTEAQLKQAVRDAYEDAAKACEKQDGVHDVIYADAIRALIKEIPE